MKEEDWTSPIGESFRISEIYWIACLVFTLCTTTYVLYPPPNCTRFHDICHVVQGSGFKDTLPKNVTNGEYLVKRTCHMFHKCQVYQHPSHQHVKQ